MNLRQKAWAVLLPWLTIATSILVFAITNGSEPWVSLLVMTAAYFLVLALALSGAALEIRSNGVSRGN